MKTITVSFFLLILFRSIGQEHIDYIRYYNYANEADYQFHEQHYDSAVFYYTKAFEFADVYYPRHHYNYSKALWKTGQVKLCLAELEEDWTYRSSFSSFDTSWFSGMGIATREGIANKMLTNSEAFIRNPSWIFIDSLRNQDQRVRGMLSDSIYKNEAYRDDTVFKEKYFDALRKQDSITGNLIIEYTKKYGFPGGKNADWNPFILTPMIHMPKEWYIENYGLLLSEVRKGNLEPFILAMGIDRNFSIRQGEYERICPYNWYYEEGIQDPFIVFQNCVRIGVSPYFRYYWFRDPKRVPYYDTYKADKGIYNTSLY